MVRLRCLLSKRAHFFSLPQPPFRPSRRLSRLRLSLKRPRWATCQSTLSSLAASPRFPTGFWKVCMKRFFAPFPSCCLLTLTHTHSLSLSLSLSLLFSGPILGYEGGTDAVLKLHDKLISMNISVSAFWLQDWTGDRVSVLMLCFEEEKKERGFFPSFTTRP